MVLLHEATTFDEAFETLGALADMGERLNWDDLMATEGLESEQPGLAWLEHQEPEHFLTEVRRLFSLILKRLHALEREQVSPAARKVLVAQIKGVMATVGEAAMRLDTAAQQLFGFPKGTVLGLREYGDLKGFYRASLMREIGRGVVLGDPALVRDVARVKRDRDYELAYLRKESGRSFLSRGLKQNLTLVADFELYGADYLTDDPLVQLQVWVDEMRCSAAAEMVEELHDLVSADLGGDLRAAWTALRMAANPENALLNGHAKACLNYFDDFVSYLRAAVREDQGELAQAMCTALYTARAKSASLDKLLKKEKGETLAEHLELEDGQLRELLEHHPNGPLFKLIDLLHEEEIGPFDPLLLGNMPEELATVHFGDDEVHVLRLPSPTVQEYIHTAHVDPTYRLFHGQGNHLLINLQDRMSWREGARAFALEELGAYSLGVDTDFYHQRGEHRQTSSAEQFLDHFFEQLQGPHHSYTLPADIFDFVDELLGGIQSVFFWNARELSLRERKAFIDLAHLFIVLKLIERDSPDYLAFVDKDGVDAAGAATAGLLSALALLRGEMLENEGALHKALFFAPLLTRERALLPGRMDRLLYMLERLEKGLGHRHLFDEELQGLFTDRVL